MLEKVADWIKFASAVAVIASAVMSFGVKLVERFTAIPVLQKDVKSLKHQMRFVVHVAEKSSGLKYERSIEDD